MAYAKAGMKVMGGSAGSLRVARLSILRAGISTVILREIPE